MGSASCRTILLLLALLALCTSSNAAAASRKLRGTRARRGGRGLNEAESLLFTEGLGRKGGDKDYDSSDEDGASKEEYWVSEMTSGDVPPGPDPPGATKQKSKDKAAKNTAPKAVSEPAMKGTSEPSTKGADKEPPVPPVPDSGDVPREEPSEDMTGAPKGGGKDDKDKDDKDDDEDDDEPGIIGKGAGKGQDSKEPVASPPAQEPVSAPATDNAAYGEVSTEDQVEFVMSRFGLEFQLADTTTTVARTANFAEVEASTIAYLKEYLELTYSADPMIFFSSVTIEVTSRRTGGTSMTPFVDLEASVAFAVNSPMTPTNEEIGMTISEAFTGTNLSTYLFSLAQRLTPDNPFLTTTKVTVYVPDPSSSGATGRVAQDDSKLSAAGIAAAASTGVLTLLVGGFLLFKIKKENEEIQGGKYGKTCVGGATLAGDTYCNSTLAATLRNEDGTYNDDRSILSDLPPELADTQIRENGTVPVEERSDSGSVPFDCSPGQTIKYAYEEEKKEEEDEYEEEVMDSDSDDGNDDDDQEPVEKFLDEESDEDFEDAPKPSARTGGAYASLVDRTKALVPSLKQSAPLSNVDIKNYFKSKYNCKSPGYDAVDEPMSADNEVAGAPDDEQSVNRIHDSRDLALPALDHDTGGSVMTDTDTIGDGRKHLDAYDDDDESSQSSQPREVFRKHGNAVLGGQDPSRGRANNASDVVPRLPSEVQGYSRVQGNKQQGETGYMERSFDEVSLDTMTTMTEI